MDQKIKIEPVETNCLAEVKEEIFIKVENLSDVLEPKLERNESAFLEDPLNVSNDAKELFSYEIKTEIKSETSDVSENCSEIVIKTEQDSLVINPVSTISGANRSFQCDRCNKQYSHKSHLTQHISSVHDGKKHECDHCKKQFSHKFTLTRHISNVHDRKKYECVLCNKQFSDKGSLKRHVSVVHEGINLNSCKSELKEDGTGKSLSEALIFAV